ncbi:MAG: threonine synthase [bacterium]|nr:threonine synthase [bacterium]
MSWEKSLDEIEKQLLPSHKAQMVFECLECGRTYHIDQFLYTCPSCKSLLRIVDRNFDHLKKVSGQQWRRIFTARRMLNLPSLKGIFLFYELILPCIPLDDVVYLGEGHTPLVQANDELSALVGADFFIKYDGLNPSASFKDRGMASAVSFINYSIRKRNISQLLGICASTGDTSAAAALYLSYLKKGVVRSVVLLPQGKVTSQQLSQPLGSGATVIEISGVFDDCMKIVEELSENYEVFLLNSKNPVRIMGQKSYSYEVAQQMDYDTTDLVVVVPIGNAGNITAVMEGFVDLYRLEIIPQLPRIIGVQSQHANPIARWWRDGRYQPIKVKPSVAQAAMIGDPVSFPKVSQLVSAYFQDRFSVVEVTEQEIIDQMLEANRHGHIVCTQGGESIAGVKKAVEQGLIKKTDKVVVDSTSHQLKFSGFQQMYFEDRLPKEYEIRPRKELQNRPIQLPASASQIAQYLNLQRKSCA